MSNLFANIKTKFSKNRNIVKLVGGTALAQIINVGLSPIISRLYSPVVFGEYSIFISIIGILSVISCFRYEFAIMLPDSDSEASNIAYISSIICIVVGVLVASGVLLFGWSNGGNGSFLNININNLFLVGPGIVIFGLYNILIQWQTRKKRYGSLASNSVLNAIITNGGQVVSGFLGFATSIVQIYLYVFSKLAANIFLVIDIKRRDKNNERINIDELKKLLVKYKRFPIYDLFSTLLNTMAWQLMPVLINRWFGAKETGYYSMSIRIIQLPMSFIGAAIGRVFYQECSEIYNINKTKVKDYVVSVIKKLIFLGFFPLLIIGLYGDRIFFIILGPNWVEAGRYSQILTFWAFVWFVASPISSLLLIVGRQRALLLFNSIIMVTRILSIYLGVLFDKISYSIFFYSLSGFVVYMLLIVYVLKISESLIDRGPV